MAHAVQDMQLRWDMLEKIQYLIDQAMKLQRYWRSRLVVKEARMSLLREMWNHEVVYMMSDLHKLKQRSKKQNNQLERLKRLDVSMRENALKSILDDALILN